MCENLAEVRMRSCWPKVYYETEIQAGVISQKRRASAQFWWRQWEGRVEDVLSCA